MNKDKRERVIKGWIQGHYDQRANEDLELSDELIFANDVIMDTVCDDPESAWQLILDIIKRDSNETIMFDLGAGPLEMLLDGRAEQFIDRIEDEARINRAFRIALSGVWNRGFSYDIWTRIGAAVSNPVTH